MAWIRKHPYLTAFSVIAVLLALLFLVSPFIQFVAYVCERNEYTNKPDCTQHYLGLYLLFSAAEIVNHYNGFVAAMASALVAWFTATLWITSTRQAELTRESIDLARDEFNATHRPEIIIHGAEHAKVPGTAYVGANISFVNKGTAPAKNVIISGKIALIEGRPLPGIPFPEINKMPIALAGIIYTFGLDSKVEWGFRQMKVESVAMWQSQPPDTKNIYCFGEITYDDAVGATRHTGFCWKWETDKGRHRWIRQSRSSYDYAY